MQEFKRKDRVGAEIRKELASLIRDEVRDPRLLSITIQEVRVSRDLAHAKVYYTMLEKSGLDQVQKALDKAANFLRRKLSDSMRLRSVPQLHFSYDVSIDEGARLSALIDSVTVKDPQPDNDG
jgi:ribosome-binding factor A